MEVNCPYEGCDFPIATDYLDDGDVIECPECGEYVEISNNGTKLTTADPETFEDYDDEEEEEEN